MPTPELVALSDATTQEIQLELIRRTAFNSFDGARVYAALIKHRVLWSAVLLDRAGTTPPYGSTLLPLAGLIKLRDLPAGEWNADTLYVLTPTTEVARQLARELEAERLGGEVIVYEDRQEVDAALGESSGRHGLLTVWWD